MISHDTDRKLQNERLIDSLNKLEGSIASGTPPFIQHEVAENFFTVLEELPFDLLPYSAVSQFVYSNKSIDFMYFIEKLEEYITNKYQKHTDDYKKGIKILEHMELAIQQKDYLYEKHELEIERIKRITSRNLKRSLKIEDLQSATEKLQADNEKIMTNYISILGIFAAILMGAFGAIQGFTSLFANAHELNLGVLLIISSIGASAVLLILFFLLNGISKLTGRSLWSTENSNGTLLEKHPSLVISHGILILSALTGAALELSNISIKFAWQGLWWIIPIGWLIYLIIAFSSKKMLPSFDRYFKKDNIDDLDATPNDKVITILEESKKPPTGK